MTDKRQIGRVPVSQTDHAGARSDYFSDVLYRISKHVGHLGHRDTELSRTGPTTPGRNGVSRMTTESKQQNYLLPMEIEIWPIERLRPYPRNPRRNDARDRSHVSVDPRIWLQDPLPRPR